LQIGIELIERGLPCGERLLLGLEVRLLGVDVLRAGVQPLRLAKQLLFARAKGLFAVLQVGRAGEQFTALRLERSEGRVVLVEERLPLALERLQGLFEFLLASVEFGPKAFLGLALLLELALISDQLRLFLLEPGKEALCLGDGHVAKTKARL